MTPNEKEALGALQARVRDAEIAWDAALQALRQAHAVHARTRKTMKRAKDELWKWQQVHDPPPTAKELFERGRQILRDSKGE